MVFRFESESWCNCVQCICVPIFHTFNIHWPHCTCHLQYTVICPTLIAVKYQVSVALWPESPCWNTEDCQHLAYVQREEGWSWTTVGFNALCLIYLRLPPCTLRNHPVCQTVLWGSCVCHFSSMSQRNEEWLFWHLSWVLGYFLIYNKEQEGNPKLSVSCQAMDWSYRILMAIVGKEKLVCFNTSGSLSSLWSSAISNGFMPQAVVCFVNLRDVEITKCPFLECGWIRSKRYYRTLTLFCGNKSKRSHSVVVMRNNVEYNPGIPSQPLRVQDKE